ncbi:MAG: hypothetical protein LBK82_04130, partial [Planctomycetaceae bacterium]|nr:hypothetical protein [Planctomycetaceae bacterium]
MKIRLLFVLLLLLGMCSVVGVVKGQELRSDSVDSLAAGFGTPPDSAKLWAYWWWLNGNVDKESITKDLTEMYKQGFGGALLCDAGGASQDGNDNVPAGAMFGSPEWRELYKHALNEAAKLGMSVSLNIQSGWNLGGPDVKPENATKVVVWSETKFNTADQNAPPTELLLPQPKTNHNFYQDIAVVAVRTKSIDETKNDPDKTATATAQSSQKNFPPELAVDGNPETFWVSSGTEAGKGPSKEASESFALFFPKVIKATGIAITPRAGYGPDSCALFVAENDPKEINYKPIKFFNVKKEGETIISFDSVAGNIFQLVIFSAFDPNYPNAPRNVQIAEIELLDGNTRFGKSIVKNNPKPLNHLGAKIAIKELGGSAPNCDYLVEDEEELESDEEHIVKAWFVSEKNENGDIRFIASLGEGDWSVLRFGYTCTGARVSTASGKWQGLVVDYLDADAFDIYWKNNVQPLIDDAGSLAGKTLRYLHTDSWELGGVNWTKTMRDEFKKRRGYDVIEYLPILAGKIIKNREVSNRFLFDFRRTIGDLIADNHYGRMKAKGREFGIGVHPESGGPHAAPIDSLQLLGMSDIPMSEYWSWSPRHRVGDPNRFFIKQPASAAHTHGKRLVAAEGFTNIGMHWQESFADNLKPAFDQSICEGCNLLVWHAFTASPKSAGLPGQEYFAGTHFNPQHTCWNYSADFLSYINRSQFLMQQGLYAADVVQ